jgi:hypothetical protein
LEEKQKMKKVFGIPLAALLIGLMVIGGATAALVNYLSNTAMSIEMGEVVHSAVNTGVDERIWEVNRIVDYETELSGIATTGLSSVYLGVKLENLADVDIEDKILKVVLSNNLSDVTCADLTSLTFIDSGASETSGNRVEQELAGIGLCTQGDGVATYNIPINLLNAGTVYKYPVKVTFGNVAPATYSFDAQVVLD